MDINNNILSGFIKNNFLNTVGDKKLNIENNLVESIKTENLDISLTDEIKLILNNLNLTPTKENIKLLDILIKNSITLTDTNIKTMIQTNKMSSSDSVEKALFLISNKMQPTKENINQIEKYMFKEADLNKEIENLFKSLIDSEETISLLDNIFKGENFSKDVILAKEFLNNVNNNIKKEVFAKLQNNNTKDIINILDEVISKDIIFDKNKLNIIKDIFYKENINKDNFKNLFSLDVKTKFETLSKQEFNIIKDALLFTFNNKKLKPEFEKTFKNIEFINKTFEDKFTFNLDKNNMEDIGEFYNEINSITHKIKKGIGELGINSDKILDNISDVEKNLSFMSNIKDGIFLQIPIMINNNPTNTELFVFSDKKNSKNKKGNNGSALLSLNLVNIGKLEAYIHKIDNNIYCQFRLEDEDNIKFLRDNIFMLDEYLKEKNLLLKDVVVKKLDEKFNIITNYKNKANDNIKLSSFNAKA